MINVWVLDEILNAGFDAISCVFQCEQHDIANVKGEFACEL
jgi:hypothetical protein